MADGYGRRDDRPAGLRILKSNDQAIQWVPLVLLPMIIFSGGMIRLSEMPSGVSAIALLCRRDGPTKRR